MVAKYDHASIHHAYAYLRKSSTAIDNSTDLHTLYAENALNAQYECMCTLYTYEWKLSTIRMFSFFVGTYTYSMDWDEKTL